MGGIEILAAGPYSTIQDKGRSGYQHLGVPISGALDDHALMIGNTLIGNSPDCSAIEICFGGFAALFHQACTISLTGSVTAQITHHDGTGKQTIFAAATPIPIRTGERIEIPSFGDSLSVLLCLSGGLDLPLLYGSQSTTPNAKLGGLDGRILQKGDHLSLGPSGQKSMLSMSAYQADSLKAFFAKPQMLRIMLGPQDFWFTNEAIVNLTKAPYKVLPQTSRMGMRLAGAHLAHKGPADIVSDGMIRGAIQVPADGQPIIAMADHGTMGGYTKIGCVISADIAAMGRLRPLDEISFATVTDQEATQAARQKQAEIAAILSA